MQTHLVTKFVPDVFKIDDVKSELQVNFRDFIYDPKREKALQRTFVIEDSLTQEFWIEVAKGKDGWRIRPLRGCGMVPTKGAQKALDLMRDAIQVQGIKD